LNSIIPYGHKMNFVSNALAIGRILQRECLVDIHPLVILLGSLIIQVIMFLTFRATLGAFYLYVLRYKMDAKSLMWGLFVYTADFFGPFRYVWRVLTHNEPQVVRRTLYCLVGLLMLFMEYHGARGFFYIRIVVSLLDKIFINSIYGRSSHFLEFNVDMGQVAFPQEGAYSWTSLKTVWDICSDIGRLDVEKDGNSVRGVGFLVAGPTKTLLYTIAHVVHGSRRMRFHGTDFANPLFSTIGEGDAVVACAVDLPCSHSVSLVTQSEIFDISYLLYILIDEDGERMMNIVPNHTIIGGKIHASIDLKKGDSGGPVFSVLKNGNVRYCGAVSKGSTDQGSGNIMSVIHSSMHATDSDDDASLGHASVFGAARRVHFAGAAPDLGVARKNFNNSVAYYAPDLAYFSLVSGRLPSPDDLTNMSIDDLSDKFLDKRREDDSDARHGYFKGDDFDDTVYEGKTAKGKKRHDAKRRQKDAAVRKQGFASLKAMVPTIRLAYCESDVAVLIKQFALGNVPSIHNPLDSYFWKGGHWLIDSGGAPTDDMWAPMCDG